MASYIGFLNFFSKYETFKKKPQNSWKSLLKFISVY